MSKRDYSGRVVATAGGMLLAAARNRFRSMGTQTTGGNRTVSVVDANAQQYSRSGKSYNRRRKGFYRKLLRSQKEARYLRLQGITSFDTSGGYYLCNQASTNPANSTCLWPLYLIDYKATNNVNNGVDINGQVLWRLQTPSANSTANVSFVQPRLQQSSQGANDVNSNVWQPENFYSQTGVSISYPHRRTLINYIQAKFMFYGTLTRPVRWRVEMIRLNRDWLHPDFEITTDVSTGAGMNVLLERNAFWQYMLKPFVETPLCIQDPKMANYYTKVKTLCDFVIEPKLNTEPAADIGESDVSFPHQRQFDYFERMDAVVKYDWDDTNVRDYNTLGYQVNTGENKGSVNYRSRVYIMIRALAPVNNTSLTNQDLKIDPTFDMILRKKELTLQA